MSLPSSSIAALRFVGIRNTLEKPKYGVSTCPTARQKSLAGDVPGYRVMFFMRIVFEALTCTSVKSLEPLMRLINSGTHHVFATMIDIAIEIILGVIINVTTLVMVMR